MANSISRQTAGAIAMFAVLTAATIALAQPAVDWFTVDNSGGRMESTDGSIVVTGSIGQPDASLMLSSNDGSITIIGGFIGGIMDQPAPCEGDYNNDGVVTVADFITVLLSFGSPYDVSDFIAVLLNFGTRC